VKPAREGIATIECGGARVRVEHADGWSTTYFHLDQVPNEINGQRVTRETRIGVMSTKSGSCGGYARGAHLHFTVYRYGKEVDLEGHDIGGWTISDVVSNNVWDGCLSRDGQTVCANESSANALIYNDGTVGSGEAN
jgi:LasA protease